MGILSFLIVGPIATIHLNDLETVPHGDTTAQKLRSLTDRGKFERLANSILRAAEPSYSYIISQGINEQAEPVPNPIDAIGQVPDSNPSRWIMVAHTTTDRGRLRGKWLTGEKGKESDLEKIRQKAVEIRQSEPSSMVQVVLTTNQRVDEDESLYIDVKMFGLENELELDIWEQSRLAHFLNNKPEGQWLREQYLHIKAERVSRSLLRAIAERTHELYVREHAGGEAIWVRRDSTEDLTSACIKSRSAVFLVGQSGFGKSTLAAMTLGDVLSDGHIGLWVDAADVADSHSLPEAVGKTLRRRRSGLVANVGQQALVCLKASDRLVVAVDDVNRQEQSAHVLKRLSGWIEPLSEGNEVNGSPHTALLCPVRSAVWRSAPRKWKQADHIYHLSVGAMEEDVAAKLVERTYAHHGLGGVSKEECRQIAHSLGFDPAAIVFSAEWANNPSEVLQTGSGEIVRKFLETSVKEAVQEPSFLPTEYMATLRALARGMLEHRDLSPTWTTVKEWLREEEVNALRELTAAERILWLEGEISKRRLTFRHQRVRDEVLTLQLEESVQDEDLDIITDPYFEELIADTATRSVNEASLSSLRHAPLTLFYSLKYVNRLSNAERRSLLSRIEAVIERRNKTNGFLEPERREIEEVLLNADDPKAVLGICHDLDWHNWRLELARLSAGDLQAGIDYLGRRELAPGTRDRLRDQAISRSKDNYPGDIKSAVEAFMEREGASDCERRGLFVLAGLLKLPKLDDAIESCWVQAVDPEEVLAAAIWCACRCATERTDEVLNQLFSVWKGMSAERDEYGMSDQAQLGSTLRLASRYPITDSALDFIIERADHSIEFGWVVLVSLLPWRDEPRAVEVVAREAAEIKKEAADAGGFSPWAHSAADYWDTSMRNRRLSVLSLDRLEAIWQDSTEAMYVRKKALSHWLRASPSPSVETLQSIPRASELYGQALQQRVRSEDETAIEGLLSRLEKNPEQWLRFAHNLWGREVKGQVNEVIERFGTEEKWDGVGWELARLLTQIPRDDSEWLLTEYWEQLKSSIRFIQAALYIGTDKTRSLASEAVDDYEGEDGPFHLVTTFFGIGEVGRRQNLGPRHLRSLEPYLSQLESIDLYRLATLSARLGERDWGRAHLRPYLAEEDRVRFFPTEEELRNYFVSVTSQDEQISRALWHWEHQMSEVPSLPERTVEAAKTAVEKEPTDHRFQVLAKTLQQFGTRADLGKLDEIYQEIPALKDYAEVIAATKFEVRSRTLT